MHAIVTSSLQFCWIDVTFLIKQTPVLSWEFLWLVSTPLKTGLNEQLLESEGGKYIMSATVSFHSSLTGPFLDIFSSSS